MSDTLFYAALAVIGSLPVFLVVASLSRVDLANARSRTVHFLEEWGGVAPKGLADWVRLTFGSSVGFALLIVLAYSFNFAGDHSMPTISSAFKHFGVEYTEWSVDHFGDWKQFRNHVKLEWVELHPDENLENDPAAWAAWKNNRGKRQVRAFRTLVWFSFLVCLAGLIDVFRKRYWRRGLVCIVFGLLAVVTFSLIWADRKAHYVEAVVVANSSLGDKAAKLPGSFPHLP